jgi:DNA-binding XRE family transcriptional regulator
MVYPSNKMKTKRLEPNQAVRAVRETCEMTQRQFALKLGLSWRTVVSIERGERNLTGAVANRMMLAFGVLPWTVLNKKLQPRSLDGQIYAKEFFEKRHGIAAKNAPVVLEPIDNETIQKACKQIEVLQRAAAEKGMLLAVQFHFQEWLSDKMKELGLAKDFHDRAKRMGLSDLARKPLLELSNGGLLWRYGLTKAVCLNMPKTIGEKLLTATGKDVSELHQREKLPPPRLTKAKRPGLPGKGDTNTRGTL